MNRLLAVALIALVPGVAVPCCWWCRRPAPVVLKPVEPILKKDLEADKWVTIRGRIVWDKTKGDPPKRVAIKATKDEAVANKDGDFYTEDWVINEQNLGIKNVVVWLAPEPTAEQLTALKEKRLKIFPSFQPADVYPEMLKPPTGDVFLDTYCCRFVPHVVAAREGQYFVLRNRSAAPHNAKWTSRENSEINPLIPQGGQRRFDRPLVAEKFPIEIACSIHPWMKAWVRVFDHPYFAITDHDGRFEIKNAPVLKGKLRIFIWQESGGMQHGAEGRLGETIEVTGGLKDLKEIKYDGK